jgi:hypothetical protein
MHDTRFYATEKTPGEGPCVPDKIIWDSGTAFSP